MSLNGFYLIWHEVSTKAYKSEQAYYIQKFLSMGYDNKSIRYSDYLTNLTTIGNSINLLTYLFYNLQYLNI